MIEIAKLFGYSSGHQIRKLLVENGICVRNRNSAYRKISIDDDWLINAYVNEKLSSTYISRELNCSKNAVIRKLNSLGISTHRIYDHKNLVGERFGRLVVVKLSDERDSKNRLRWECICDCGNTHVVTAMALCRGVVNSCGCLRKEFIPPNKIEDRYEYLRKRLYKNLIIKRSKQQLKERGEYDLTYNDFCQIITQPCHYCGALNTNYIRDYSNKRHVLISDTVIHYNGIDRVDSSIGYMKSNVVACCKKCNIAKSTMTVAQFKDWLIKVYNYFVCPNTILI